MIIKKLFFFLIIIPAYSQAGSYIMPVDISSSSSGISVIQKIISWDEGDAPNPCYLSPQCWLGLDVLYSSLGTPNLGGTCRAGNCIEISQFATKKDVLNAFRKKFGVPYQSSPFIIDNNNATCVGMFYIKERPHDGFGRGILWPESVCGKLPPLNQSCEVYLPSYIDHGTVSSNNLDGHSKTVNGTINCSKSGTVRLYGRSITGEREIYMNKSKTLFSEIEINGKNTWNGVDIKAQANRVPSNFSFTSTLRTSTSIPAGEYEGTSVVLLSYP